MQRIHEILKTGTILVVLWLMTASAWAQDDHFVIFLCIGHSNMSGKGELVAEHIQPDSRMVYLPAINSRGGGQKKQAWQVARPPLCHDGAGMSAIDFFGNTVCSNLPKTMKVGLIAVTVDDCDIDVFDKGTGAAYASRLQGTAREQVAEYDGKPYHRLVTLAKKAQKEGVIRGIILQPNEKDTFDDQWIKKVGKIYQDLLKDLKLDHHKVPLVVSEVGQAREGCPYAAANTTINQLSAYIPNTHIVSTENCHLLTDKIHFNSEGYHTLGIRYAIVTLNAMGFGFEGSQKYQQAEHVHHVQGIDIQCYTEKSVAHVTSTLPIERVDYVDENRDVLMTLDTKGKMETEIDISKFPRKQQYVFVFYSYNGSSVDLVIER